MTWEWPKINERDLARYVTEQSVNWLTLSKSRFDLKNQPGGLRLIVQEIYESLMKKGIKYDTELYDPSAYIQPIRTPPEMFVAPQAGTCLDLAALFCGLCLGFDLLPLIVVVQGHALAAVSVKCGKDLWDDWARDEKAYFDKALLTDVTHLRELIDRRVYVAVECTGFAASKTLPATRPEGIGRKDGLLPFERAVAAGREQLDLTDRPFVFALDIATTRFEGVVANSIDAGVESTGYSIYREYRKRFKEALEAHLPEFLNDFGSSFALEGEEAVAGDLLEEKTRAAKRLILRGYAGGGKSALLGKCARQILDKQHFVPVVINLKKWTQDDATLLSDAIEQQKDLDEKLSLLFRVSITDLNPTMLDRLPDAWEKLVMVDGLNEVYGREATREILDLLDDYVRLKGPFVYVVVTDRMAHREARSTAWKLAQLNLLSLDEVQQRVGKQAWKQLSDADKELLRIPYYLAYALKSGATKLGSASKVHESFFRDSFFPHQGTADEAGLERLAKAAFEAYQDYKSPSFGFEKFHDEIGEEIWQKLVESAVVIVSENDARFDHQLKHDYLASRHLAHHEELWDSRSFDIVSFESKTFEPLLMTLEQLSNVGQADRFLTAVYDWNWVATARALTSVSWSGSKPFSGEMEICVAAVVAEKLFDHIRPTRERARIQLSQLPESLSEPFMKAESLAGVLTIVKAFKSEIPWFVEWRDLFTRYQGPGLGEDEIRKIASANPILGWTTSNVIKRFKLTEPDLRQLRGIYDGVDPIATQLGNVIQWRVVHALGSFDTTENINLLFRALDSESHHWVKFGAARSLIEIAAISESIERREGIIKGIESRMSGLARKVIDEVGNAIFYYDAPASWNDLIVPLMTKIRDAQPEQTDRDHFDRILGNFSAFMETESGNTTRS